MCDASAVFVTCEKPAVVVETGCIMQQLAYACMHAVLSAGRWQQHVIICTIFLPIQMMVYEVQGQPALYHRYGVMDDPDEEEEEEDRDEFAKFDNMALETSLVTEGMAGMDITDADAAEEAASSSAGGLGRCREAAGAADGVVGVLLWEGEGGECRPAAWPCCAPAT